MINRKVIKSVSLVLVLTIFCTAVVVAPAPACAAGSDTASISISSKNNSELNNIEKVTSDFIKQYGENNTSKVVAAAIDVPERNSIQPQGAVSITTKVLKKLLKENLSTVVKYVRKVPVVGNSIANFLQKNAKPLISFLDKVEGGAYGALVRFFVSMGMKRSTAEIWADVIVTVAGLLI